MRRIRPVHIMSHPSLYDKIEDIRKKYKLKGINISQVKATDILARRLKPLNKIDLLGGNL